MGFFGWIVTVFAIVVVLFVVQTVYLSVVLKWADEETRGLAYYGRPQAERLAFKKKLRRHAVLLYPILRLMGRSSKFTFQRASFQHRGIAGPIGSCTKESFAKADQYRPTADDVFVVTQMKCGTTWMQQVVYEVLHRGAGNLVDTGTAMYAVSPWVEGIKSVPIEQSKLLGQERPSRIIKTHLPATHCPWSSRSKYIYVARHPVSCFASCFDFVATNAGAMAPSIELAEEWFCSPEWMWWGPWPDHVAGWWEKAQAEKNILFVSFEDMKRDLGAVVTKVTAFLGMTPLNPAELAQVVRKSSFQYMQAHQESFEMNPPHLLQADAELFVRGSADRHKDVPEEVQRRIAAWCARSLRGRSFPLATNYPDVAAAGESAGPIVR